MTIFSYHKVLKAQNLFNKKFTGTLIIRLNIGPMNSEIFNISTQKYNNIVLRNIPEKKYDIYVLSNELTEFFCLNTNLLFQ